MKKFITIVLAIFALEAGIILVGSGAAHADAQATFGDVDVYASSTGSVRVTKMCTYDEVEGGQACGSVRLYGKGSLGAKVKAEGKDVARYASCETGRKVQYLGWSKTNFNNHDHYLTSRSSLRSDRFHLVRVTSKRFTPKDCSFPNI